MKQIVTQELVKIQMRTGRKKPLQISKVHQNKTFNEYITFTKIPSRQKYLNT